MKEELRIAVADRGEVSAILLSPPGSSAVYLLAHGAGADMRHSFMEATATRLADRGIATLRYQFPYSEAGRKRPDHFKVLEATVAAAAARADAVRGDLPLLAGGKSMGGRITSQAAAKGLISPAAIVFLGFPLHAPGKPSSSRFEHVGEVEVPMLFVQGTRDKLAELELLGPRVAAHPLAEMHIVDGGDHSFHVLKRSGRTDEEALDEVADAVAAFAARVTGAP